MIFNAIQASATDNVATMICDAHAGEQIRVRLGPDVKLLEIKEDIPYGHKVSLCNIKEQAWVVKYGECIGVANQFIPMGRYVHIHNVQSKRGRGDLQEGNL